MKTKKLNLNRLNASFLMIPFLLLALMACSGDDDAVQEQPIPAEFGGNYVGTWNSVTPSTTFVDYPISATLQIVDNTLTGSWYGTNTFVPCCTPGDDDGSITMEFNGMSEISSFVLNDIIPDCSGVFTGTGVVRENDNAFVVSFTGSDCDGLHSGEIVLIKE